MPAVTNLCICGDPECKIPFGYCHCRCGKKTTIWTQNHTRLGGIKGLPHKYFGKHKATPIEDAAPFKIDGVYCRLIPLTKGFHAIVDAADYKWLMRWNWNATFYKNTASYYALKRESGKGEGKTISMQRFILGLVFSDNRTADHRNGNTLDNRRKNLRIVTEDQSAQNRGMQSNNKSGFKGVYLSKRSGKYTAQIKANGHTYHLGECSTPEAAHALYCAAAEKLHGEFRRLV